MRRTSAWLKAQGAIVIERIEDPLEGMVHFSEMRQMRGVC
jgi:ribosomal protein S1